MGRRRFSSEQIIVKLREAEIIESKGLTQVETEFWKPRKSSFLRTVDFPNEIDVTTTFGLGSWPHWLLTVIFSYLIKEKTFQES